MTEENASPQVAPIEPAPVESTFVAPTTPADTFQPTEAVYSSSVPAAAPQEPPPADPVLGTPAALVTEEAPPAENHVAIPVADHTTIHAHLKALEQLALYWGGEAGVGVRNLVIRIRDLLTKP